MQRRRKHLKVVCNQSNFKADATVRTNQRRNELIELIVTKEHTVNTVYIVYTAPYFYTIPYHTAI